MVDGAVVQRVCYYLLALALPSTITFTYGGYGRIAAELGAAIHRSTDELVVQLKTHCLIDRMLWHSSYADCSNMKMREVPQNLEASVVVFDLSGNRIRRLTRKSFSCYARIKLLYLCDNVIHHIGAYTFAQLDELEAIDLSTNALTTISTELLNLPRLWKLRYNDNPLEWERLEADLRKLAKPVAAPLQSLSLADCSLKAIPHFGILPHLVQLNVSFNIFDALTPQQFSPFCRLREVAIGTETIATVPWRHRNQSIQKSNAEWCGANEKNPNMCIVFHSYFIRRQISVNGLTGCSTCTSRNATSHPHCANTTSVSNDSHENGAGNDATDSLEFLECMSYVDEMHRVEQSKWTWTIAAVVIIMFAAFSLSLALSVVYIRYRQRCL